MVTSTKSSLHSHVICSIIYNSQDRETAPNVHRQMNEWIKEMCYIYNVEYYSAFKKETLRFLTTWMNPEDTELSEIAEEQMLPNPPASGI